MECFEYRRDNIVVISIVICMVFWFFSLVLYSISNLFALMCGVGGTILSTCIFHEGIKKIKTCIQPRVVEIYKARKLRNVLPASDVQSVTYEISEITSDSGATTLRELKFYKKDGELAKLNVNSGIKRHFVVLDKVAKVVEGWCETNAIPFTLKVSIPKMFVRSSISTKLTEIDKILSYLSIPQIDLTRGRKTIVVLTVLSISTFVIGILCFLPSISGVSLSIPNEAFAMIGLLVLSFSCYCFLYVFKETLNHKLVKRSEIKTGNEKRDLSRWNDKGQQGEMTGMTWVRTSLARSSIASGNVENLDKEGGSIGNLG